MRSALLLIFLVALTCIRGNSQSDDRDIMEKRLEKQFMQLRERISSQRKYEINDSICDAISEYAASGKIFNHTFTNLRYLGQIMSPDSLVKLITWNLILDDGSNNYYCYLFRRNEKSEEGSFRVFSGKHTGEPIRTDTTYSLSDWYGALYYDLKPFAFEGSIRYILLGIDYGNSLTTRKVIDVLSFRDDENLQFGLKCFSDGQSLKQRIVFEYSASAVMSLKFESERSIVFDHLSPFTPEMKDNHQFYGPDFSFDSYDFENGLWKLKPDIDIRNKD